jgi:cell division protein FtsQ
VGGDAIAPAAEASLPTVTANGDALIAAMGAYSSLPTDLAGRVKAITATTRDNVDLALRGGALVHWGSAEKATEKAQVLRSLLRHRADIYDVTSPELPTMWKRG